jgi:penicillin amidase
MKKLFIAIVSILLMLAIALFYFLKSTTPDYSEELNLKGLKESVTVEYDKYAIPHIYANNQEDAYIALGYVHAKERLFQMELLKRVGSGRLAEMFGPDLLKVDKIFRTIGVGEQSKINAEFYREKGGDMIRLADKYLSGVNAFIENGPTPLEFHILGIEKEFFDLKSMFDIAGYMGYSFALAHRTDPIISYIEEKLGPEYLKDIRHDWPKESKRISVYDTVSNNKEQLSFKSDWVKTMHQYGIPLWSGSNSWAVNSKKNEGSKPILCNDTHISYGQPHIWYESHLEYPGFRVYGNYLCGVPIPLVGHNDFCGWGLTMFENDDMDLYLEKVDSLDKNRYIYKDSSIEFASRKELIKVKGGENLEIDIRSTIHGPIINEVYDDVNRLTSQPVSFWWTYMQAPTTTLQAFWKLSHCDNIDDAASAAELIDAPGLNLMYADKKDNIAWWASAKLVKRPQHVNSLSLLEGWSGDDDNLGYYDFSYNPKAINPPSNYVYSANNQPDTTKGVLYPGYYVSDHRADRITELLEEHNEWSVEKMQEMLNDAKVNYHKNSAQSICNLIKEEVKVLNDPNVNKAYELLSSWDGGHSLEDVAPTIFYNTLYKIMYYTMVDEIGVEPFKSFIRTHAFKRTIIELFEKDDSKWWDDIETDKVIETRKIIFWRAFYKSVDFLSSQLGPEVSKWHWKKVHLIEHKHPIGKVKPLNKIFNVGPASVPGGYESVNNISFLLNDTIQYEVEHGPAMRIIIDFDDVENALSIIPSGQSGHAFSPHYNDQFELYNTGKFRKMHMNFDNITKESIATMQLNP